MVMLQTFGSYGAVAWTDSTAVIQAAVASPTGLPGEARVSQTFVRNKESRSYLVGAKQKRRRIPCSIAGCTGQTFPQPYTKKVPQQTAAGSSDENSKHVIASQSARSLAAGR